MSAHLPIALAAAWLLAAPGAADGGHCVRDALDQLYCAKDPLGVAVLDNLGAARCAPGRCVEVDGEWLCSTKSGGAARLDPEGPVCEVSCASPDATDCERK